MAARNIGKPAFSCTVAAGLTFVAGALAAFGAQQRRIDELRYRVEQMEKDRHRRSDLVQQQALHFSLLSKAIDDPDLAMVLSTLDVDSPTQRRQFLFANAMYSNTLLAYRTGSVNIEELHGHLRVICQNPIFREYWEATRHHRASLDESSDESRVGRMMDHLIQDLDEADTEEWWAVGEPPSEQA
ncbi:MULTISPECIES: DUF6082 family protein [unclassified Streptomyces]|uniref:DUF6082 family protein n=1 Tax=unclassified Streptomyces TaxID=2593676 RepID=UPI002DD96BB2|nr:DUF6082 family protein [Streptomyces sp. NBC_00243]WRZ19272.1 DUF6082 family protein [Streptomyces sp. NBC_00243]